MNSAAADHNRYLDISDALKPIKKIGGERFFSKMRENAQRQTKKRGYRGRELFSKKRENALIQKREDTEGDSFFPKRDRMH